MAKAQRTVLITGATGEIGTALAHQYQERNTRLVLIGRRPMQGLDPTLFTATTYCRVDLSWPDYVRIIDQFLFRNAIDSIDLLIHYAEIADKGTTEDHSPEHIHELVTVNLYAPIALTHALLPRLSRCHGKLVFIGSVVAVLPSPGHAVYAATKAALDHFARSLRMELRRQIAVQSIHLGTTPIRPAVSADASRLIVQEQRMLAADKLALQILHAIESKRPNVTIGLKNRMLEFSGQHLNWLVDWIATRRTR